MKHIITSKLNVVTEKDLIDYLEYVNNAYANTMEPVPEYWRYMAMSLMRDGWVSVIRIENHNEPA